MSSLCLNVRGGTRNLSKDLYMSAVFSKQLFPLTGNCELRCAECLEIEHGKLTQILGETFVYLFKTLENVLLLFCYINLL